MTSLRRFISLCISFSFLIMSYTGIMLFIAPKGRVARSMNWEFLGLEKSEFTNLHVTFMVLFLVGMLFHIYLNWGSLLNYLKNRAKSFSLLTKEFLIALGLNLFFIVGTLYYWAPFEQFLDFQEEVKASWETNGAPIAKENDKSPTQNNNPINVKSQSLNEGGGYGQLTLKNASVQHTFALEKALEHIREKGFNATENSTLKEIADALHVKPIELLELLKTSTQKESK
ncbi:DUF4405 domain-containing protein [Sulfurospirillum sp. SCADC]|uniref:DUF4405 domain-containing protein n=2 Tax=unclassified Sulfurospirillum TaxID=2618290 RepID=UPI00068D1F1E|nr:DUF4405 domain-containing protein [Sulfurospirillum sp. SCADC]